MQAESLPEVAPDPIEREVFHVRSSRRGEEPWRVDMEEFCGHGACGCEDFMLRRRKALDEAAERRQPIPKSQCRHIKAVVAWKARRVAR